MTEEDTHSERDAHEGQSLTKAQDSKGFNWKLLEVTILAIAAIISGFGLYSSIRQMKINERQMIAMERQMDAMERQMKINERQTKANETAAQTGVWQNIYTQMLDIDKVFIEHPEVWPYFNNAKAITNTQSITNTDNNFNRVMALADLHLDFFDFFDNKEVRELPGMGPGGEYWILWEKYFEDTFAESPVLCLRYEQKKDWYGNVVSVYAQKGCARKTRKQKD
ncbi:MAG: hypothetical protein HZB33_15965 [Nitrospirae bacterium]|nr:hypothetical protein [Nitrospirota bacterium]